MFISTLDLFKIGIGPSSSHTMGPMVAAKDYLSRVRTYLTVHDAASSLRLRCTLKGSLAFTGKGHATDRAVALGLHGHAPEDVAKLAIDELCARLWQTDAIDIDTTRVGFSPAHDIIFDQGEALPEHPNGMIFELIDAGGSPVLTKTYFSIGGGFINTREELERLVAPIKMSPSADYPYPFDSATDMMTRAGDCGLTVAQMKRANEHVHRDDAALDAGLDAIWQAMCTCIDNGLAAEGILPGGLNVKRRAKHLCDQLREQPDSTTVNDWLCAYAMAVNEENAAGHLVVTAPTNGAAGVIPAVLRYLVDHERGSPQQVRDFLLTAAAIGGIIKHRSSISGAEVGCQGEVGSAAAMAAAGLCAARDGTVRQIEHAAEMALEHHLGMTCDPVKGLVQIPCIERNGFGAIKAWTAASLAIRGSGEHVMPLDNCIAAMKHTGEEMSGKLKETALGGLAVSLTEC